jgi:hypothetical protein
LEAVRTVNPEFCRNKLKEFYDIVLNKDEQTMREFIGKVREEFLTLKFDQVASPKGVKGLDKYGDPHTVYKRVKGLAVPIHVRGSLLYNHLLKSKGLTDIEEILEGEKIKYCYLKMPNPIGENVIAAPRTLPKEFALEEYIDYDTQFDKTFLDAVKAMNKVIGWREEELSTLEGFFA